MAIKYLGHFLCGSGLVLKNNLDVCKQGISSYRNFCVLKALYAKEKHTVQLLPEVEKLLESGDIKHRKHPGVRKIDPVILPEVLRNAVDRIVSYESEKKLLQDAKTLCDTLVQRRLPAEADEIAKKISSMVPTFEGSYHDLFEKLSKQELRILRRRINCETGRWKPIEYNHHECLAYMVGRLAANYASTSYVFKQLQERVPSFQPTSYFDFGCGVGSALWAAHTHWSDTIKEYFCVDTSAEMNELCQNILTDPTTEEKHIKPVFFRQFLPASETLNYDLVVSAFSLLDLPSAADRLRAVDTLWRKTKDYLIFIEYGTVAGFRCVLDARDFILHVENDSSPEFSYYSSGAYVVSPCPHDSACPKFLEKPNSSCGFTVPYQIQFPRKLNKAVAKDWISYVVLKKGPRPDDDIVQSRLVKPVLKKSKIVYCHLCCADGKLHEVMVTRSRHGRHAYRCARNSSQGDILPVNVMPLDRNPENV